MRAYIGLSIASILTAATAFPLNVTVETVTITKTSWSTMISTLSCPAPITVTVYDTQRTDAPSAIANNANIVYQTLSECQAGQVLAIDGMVTTLAQPTVLPVVKTISDVVLVPGSAINTEYSAVATVTDIVYPSSMTASNSQVVTCGTEVSTIIGGSTVLSNCPCTVQSTIIEVTATGSKPVPTALVPSTNYIIKIVYVYVIETVVNRTPTIITQTATSTLTTIQTGTETETQTATVTASTTATTTPRPTMATVDQVVFVLEYDTAYNGIAINNLRKRQATGSSGTPTSLDGCLARCSAQDNCVAASFDENTSSCSPLNQFDLSSRREASGSIFATVVFRPSVLVPSGSSSALINPSASISSSAATTASPSTQLSIPTAPSVSTRSSSPTSLGVSTSSENSVTSRSSSSSSRSSVLYPISNSSIISTRSTSSSASGSSIVLPVTDSSVTSSTSVSISNTSPSATSSSAIVTSSEVSTTSDTPAISTTSNFSSTSATIVSPVTDSSTSAVSSSTSSSASVTTSTTSSSSLSSSSSPSSSGTISGTTGVITSSTSSSTTASSSITSELSTSTDVDTTTTSAPDITTDPSTTASETSSATKADTVTIASTSETTTDSGTTTSETSSATDVSTTSSSESSSTSTAPVTPLTDCAVVTGLLEYAPAQAYCSSAYPLAVATRLFDVTITDIVTASGPASTMTNTVTAPFETIIETVPTSTTTTLYIPTELIVTDTVTVTETDTVSTTIAGTMRKRQASSTDAASIFASVLSRPATDIEFACSCLQTPTTTSITVTQTALSTTIVTPIVSNDLTVTPISTVQTTETATITEIATTTIATSTLETTATTTVTEVVTSTDAVCSLNAFVVLDGPKAGQTFSTYANGISGIRLTSDSSQTKYFQYNAADSTFVVTGTALYFADGSPRDNGGIGVIGEEYFNPTSYAALHCAITPADDLPYGAVATVSCVPDYPNASGAYNFYLEGSGSLSLRPVGYTSSYATTLNMGVTCP